MRLFLLAITIAPLAFASPAQAEINLSDGDSVTVGGQAVTCGGANAPKISCFCQDRPDYPGISGLKMAIVHATDPHTGAQLWSRLLAGNPIYGGGEGFEWCAANAASAICNPAATPYHSDADAGRACDELIRHSGECH
jgi:hypothetical protein